MASQQAQVIFYFIVFRILIFGEFVPVSSLQCKGENNENVDW
jgi:hypothetical protein